jgi:hypothetical protein
VARILYVVRTGSEERLWVDVLRAAPGSHWSSHICIIRWRSRIALRYLVAASQEQQPSWCPYRAHCPNCHRPDRIAGDIRKRPTESERGKGLSMFTKVYTGHSLNSQTSLSLDSSCTTCPSCDKLRYSFTPSREGNTRHAKERKGFDLGTSKAISRLHSSLRIHLYLHTYVAIYTSTTLEPVPDRYVVQWTYYLTGV